VILFACTGRILPVNSVIPRFTITISRPKFLYSSTAVASSDFNFDSYYGAAVTMNPKSNFVEKRNDAILSSITETADARNPFADPVLPRIDEPIIKSVHSPDSDQSPHRAPQAPSVVPTDYIDRSFLPEPSSPLDLDLTQDNAYLEQGRVAQEQFKR